MEAPVDAARGTMECTLSNVAHLTSLLSTLQQSQSLPYTAYDTRNDWSSVTYLYVYMSKEGLKFRTVSKGRDVYADAWLAASFFREYKHNGNTSSDEQLECMVPLQSLLHSLMIFGVHAHLKWLYSASDGIISLLLQEEGEGQPYLSKIASNKKVEGISECLLRTLDISDEVVLPDVRKEMFLQRDDPSEKFDSFCMLPSVIREVILDFSEDDDEGKVVIAIEPRGADVEEPVLYIGMAQQVTANQWDFPYHSVLFPQFSISKPYKNFYKLRSLLLLTNALRIAHGLKVDINDSGVMAVQLIIKTDATTLLYVNFYVFPTEGDEDL